MPKDELIRAVGARVAQFPVKDPTRSGTLEIKSGCLALMLPYANGKFSEDELARGTKEPVGLGDRVLVPLASGTYDVLGHEFAPERGYEDELGMYGACVRIVKAKR